MNWPRRKRKLTVEDLNRIVEAQRADLVRLQQRFYDLLDHLEIEYRCGFRLKKHDES